MFKPGTILILLVAAALLAVPASSVVTGADCGYITDPGTGNRAPNSAGVYLLKADKDYTVSLTFTNTARLHTGAWNDSFGLAPKGDAKVFNENPSMIPVGKIVHKGDKHTFKFTITAPHKRGLYELRWQMFENETPRDYFGRTATWNVRVRG